MHKVLQVCRNVTFLCSSEAAEKCWTHPLSECPNLSIIHAVMSFSIKWWFVNGSHYFALHCASALYLSCLYVSLCTAKIFLSASFNQHAFNHSIRMLCVLLRNLVENICYISNQRFNCLCEKTEKTICGYNTVLKLLSFWLQVSKAA